MPTQWTVLASGSSGNASLLDTNGCGVLLDVGVGPRVLATRMAQVGGAWTKVQAVLLTHTHSDHWNARTLAQLLARKIPLYCHDGHLARLRADCSAFSALERAKLVRKFETGEEFKLPGGLRCLPLAVRHDSGATFGFRFTGVADLFTQEWSLGYAADLGTWDADLASALVDVDVLALEFNHDVAMQRNSGRHPDLIARVLGDEGHLSNEQAANMVQAVVSQSARRRVQQLVQLHLSRQCNRPDLALRAAQAAMDALGIEFGVQTAAQDTITRPIVLGATAEAA
jgi:phosphoribosyl 1,2-cyclic phosphodiesterase